MRRTFAIVLVHSVVLAVWASCAERAPASVLGSWTGVLVATTVGASFEMEIEIKRLKVGARSGSVRYLGTPCEGPIRLRRLTAEGGYVFRHTPVTPPATFTRCSPDRILVRRDGRRLFVRLRAVDGPYWVFTGRLRRTVCGAAVRSLAFC
jgi:hypothetical protein